MTDYVAAVAAGTLVGVVLLNALRYIPSTEAALKQASDAIRAHLQS